MKILYLLILIFLTGFTFNYLSAKPDLAGKNLFYNLKGKNGITCNTCHPGGGSAGRWDPRSQAIDPDEGRKIPSLKCIGKKKSPEQIQRSIELMKKMFGFKLTGIQMEQLTEYVGTL